MVVWAAAAAIQPPSGHVFRVDRARGPVCHAKYRLPDGRQVQKKIGPAWSERGRPPAGYFTRRQAEAWLEDVLHSARRGTLPGMVRNRVRFYEAAEEWLRFIREDRERKPSTLVDYQSALRAHLLPAFGDRELDSITPEEIERRRSLKGLSNRSKNQLLIQLHGIFRRAQIVWNVPVNPLARVEKHPMRFSGDIQVFSPEEVWALVRVRVGRRAVSDGSVHGVADGRAAGVAVARRRLRRLHGQGASELRRRGADDAEVREGTGRPGAAREDNIMLGSPLGRSSPQHAPPAGSRGEACRVSPDRARRGRSTPSTDARSARP